MALVFRPFSSSVCSRSYTTLTGLSFYSWLSFPRSLGARASLDGEEHDQESDKPLDVYFAAHQDLL